MAKRINEVEVRFPENREVLIREAASRDETCISVGGLAGNLGMLGNRPIPVSAPTVGAKAFARLIQFWRRQRQLSVEQLAERAGLTEAEVLEAEQGDTVPELRVLHALSSVLTVSYDKLLRLTGHVIDRDEVVENAAVRFAARSESMERLSWQEEELLQDFIRILAE